MISVLHEGEGPVRVQMWEGKGRGGREQVAYWENNWEDCVEEGREPVGVGNGVGGGQGRFTEEARRRKKLINYEKKKQVPGHTGHIKRDKPKE